MANAYKHKTGKVPIRGPETPGNFWLLSQAESTEGRSRKALGQTQEHSSTPGTPRPLWIQDGRASSIHLGQHQYLPRFSAPRPIPSLGSLWEGVPAHLSSKASPSSQGRRNSDEGTVESLPEEIELWLHNLYTRIQPLPTVQSRTFFTSVNDKRSPQIWRKSTA